MRGVRGMRGVRHWQFTLETNLGYEVFSLVISGNLRWLHEKMKAALLLVGICPDDGADAWADRQRPLRLQRKRRALHKKCHEYNEDDSRRHHAGMEDNVCSSLCWMSRETQGLLRNRICLRDCSELSNKEGI